MKKITQIVNEDLNVNEDLYELEEESAEELAAITGGVATAGSAVQSMEHQLQADYKKFNMGNLNYSAKQLDQQLATQVSNFQECGIPAAGNEAEIVHYVEGTDGITVDRQVREMDSQINSETQTLSETGFVTTSELNRATNEVETLAHQSGLDSLTHQQEQSILEQVNSDSGITRAAETASIAVHVEQQQAWAQSYIAGGGQPQSFGSIAADAMKDVIAFNTSGPLSQAQMQEVAHMVENSTGIEQAVEEKQIVDQVMSDYVKYDAFNQTDKTLQSADFRGMLQQDLASPGGAANGLNVGDLEQKLEMQSGTIQAQMEYETIKSAIEAQTVTSAERDALVDHPNETRNELTGYALAIESQEAGLTTTSLENQVRRAYENNNGITYEMAFGQIESDLQPINLNNGQYMNLSAAQNQEVDNDLQSQVEHVISKNLLSINSDRAEQIQAIVESVEYEDGITQALATNNAFNQEQSANPFTALQGVGHFDKPLEIFADITLGAVEITAAAAGAGAIIAGGAAAAAAGAEVAAGATEAVEAAETGASVISAVEATTEATGAVTTAAGEATPMAAETAEQVTVMSEDAASAENSANSWVTVENQGIKIAGMSGQSASGSTGVALSTKDVALIAQGVGSVAGVAGMIGKIINSATEDSGPEGTE